jgi:cell fate regulator YaaT (PSP1 superfamily)
LESVLVKLRTTRKTAYYDPRGSSFKKGQKIIIEYEKGRDYGEVILCNHKTDKTKLPMPLLHILRVANSFDLKKIQENERREKQAYKYCQKRILEHQLDMKLISVNYFFDRRKLKFLFTSWDKVDFRELVKDLCKEYKTGVELRQIGVRDAAKILGGMGICGRVTCCASHLHEFPPINLKMARVQDRSSNPDKISGICGRLRCCLRYEYEHYLSLEKAGSDPVKQDPALFQGMKPNQNASPS